MERFLGTSLLTRKTPSDTPDSFEDPQKQVIEPTHLLPTPDPADSINTSRPFRSLSKRKREHVNEHTSLSYIGILTRVKRHAVAPAQKAPLEPRKKRRPLLTELFHPQKDGDLALYEQYALHVRSFFAKWSKYIDGETDGRLPHRVLIVSGPPGCGKTCTVDIMIRKFGFRSIELETGTAFKRNLLNATSTAMESTGLVPEFTDNNYKRHGISRPYYTDSNDNIIWDSRPACVVLDCVDGLSGSDAHRFARDISFATTCSKRPIVIVCNNRFAPLLIELRQKYFSQEAVFRRPSPSELRKALIRLSDIHGVSIKRESMDKVLEVCEGDIRASLTALQFSFVHSVTTSHGAATATQLLNDKNELPDLDWLSDSDLQKLHDRVFDYSLDTDVCWDMKKLREIGEWNALCDFTQRNGDSDKFIRASLLKYRQLFKSGKVLTLRAAVNNYDTIQKVRDTIERVYSDCTVDIKRMYSKQTLLLEFIPLVSSMCGLGRSPKSQSLHQLGQLLYSAGVRHISKSEDAIIIKPDISVFGNVLISKELIAIFEDLLENNQTITTKTVAGTQHSIMRHQAKNWLKVSDTQIRASRPVQPGVWLDFKVSDENQAKRSIGLRDLFT